MNRLALLLVLGCEILPMTCEEREIFNSEFLREYKDTPQRIPAILHQIWIGSSNPRPSNMMHGCASVHSHWKYMFWTEYNLTWIPHFSTLYYKQINFQVASDIARYGVLERYGGVYIDSDTRCLRPFDPLLHTLNSTTDCWGARGVKDKNLIQNGIIGCVPHSRTMRILLEESPFRPFQIKTDWLIVGPGFLTNVSERFHTVMEIPPNYFYTEISFVAKNCEAIHFTAHYRRRIYFDKNRAQLLNYTEFSQCLTDYRLPVKMMIESQKRMILPYNNLYRYNYIGYTEEPIYTAGGLTYNFTKWMSLVWPKVPSPQHVGLNPLVVMAFHDTPLLCFVTQFGTIDSIVYPAKYNTDIPNVLGFHGPRMVNSSALAVLAKIKQGNGVAMKLVVFKFMGDGRTFGFHFYNTKASVTAFDLLPTKQFILASPSYKLTVLSEAGLVSLHINLKPVLQPILDKGTPNALQDRLQQLLKYKRGHNIRFLYSNGQRVLLHLEWVNSVVVVSAKSQKIDAVFGLHSTSPVINDSGEDVSFNDFQVLTLNSVETYDPLTFFCSAASSHTNPLTHTSDVRIQYLRVRLVGEVFHILNIIREFPTIELCGIGDNWSKTLHPLQSIETYSHLFSPITYWNNTIAAVLPLYDHKMSFGFTSLLKDVFSVYAIEGEGEFGRLKGPNPDNSFSMQLFTQYPVVMVPAAVCFTMIDSQDIEIEVTAFNTISTLRDTIGNVKLEVDYKQISVQYFMFKKHALPSTFTITIKKNLVTCKYTLVYIQVTNEDGIIGSATVSLYCDPHLKVLANTSNVLHPSNCSVAQIQLSPRARKHKNDMAPPIYRVKSHK